MDSISLYCFSPTGGTKQVAETFCAALDTTTADLTVVAAPVFAGRIPALVAERLSQLDGKGKKAVALVVYGVRAYEDALLELTDVLTGRGFQVIGAGAFVARHSIVPQVGAGRPDEQDKEEIQEFAKKVMEKIERGEDSCVQVPGNHPYRERSKSSATPVSFDACSQCGGCVAVCPTEAIRIENGTVVTDPDKCIMCMACVYACPQKARLLPQPVQEGMNEKLGALLSVRRENEYFL